MITVSTENTWLNNGKWEKEGPCSIDEARSRTISYEILKAHHRNPSSEKGFNISFDVLTSHDITFVGIIQTAIASGLKNFPMPYILTNCHNSLCAVGGTINEDDHVFGLSAAKKFGGDFVPAHLAVIHQYIREMFAGCGKMILGSDSHTRYGALGTLAMGEGGPELVKQLLGRTYDIPHPEVIAVWLDGTPRPGVGPQDVALSIISKVFDSGFARNKILEFMGPGLKNLSVDYRIGIDVMTTETTCLSSIWETDDAVESWLNAHGRADDFKRLRPANSAYYDGKITVNLSEIPSMIALPFHPSNAMPIKDFLNNPKEALDKVAKEGSKISPLAGDFEAQRKILHNKIIDGNFVVDQSIVAGCSGGTYENMVRVAQIVEGKNVGQSSAGLSAYPASQPLYLELVKKGYATSLLSAGATIKTAFCGPCFGAGDVPANGDFSIRHVTRNFPNREGSKPTDKQISYVALMDARSIAATAANNGRLMAATDLPNPPEEKSEDFSFDRGLYEKRVYMGSGKALPETKLIQGPNIAPWPQMQGMPENLLLAVACTINDPVTTTDELIPSGETSSYRSNPHKLAEFTLSRKDPEYVNRAKRIREAEEMRQEYSNGDMPEKITELFERIGLKGAYKNTGMGSVVASTKPGDGSAREQAASCQKVLGGWANIAEEYATKRYRSNLINWGIIPFITKNKLDLENDDLIYLEGIKEALETGKEEIKAKIIKGEKTLDTTLFMPKLSRDERNILLSGCLINYYSAEKK